MATNILGWKRVGALVGLSALCLLPSLGNSGRLSYHEAIWAQSAREMLERGDFWVPSLDGRPWLEKPPLGVWPIAVAGWLFGGVDETVARLPSVLAAISLAVAVATFTARRFGGGLGLLAGSIQVTSIWLVTHGRLAEVDVTLVCLTTWAVVAFDRLRKRAVGDGFPRDQTGAGCNSGIVPAKPARRSRAVWAFYSLLGATALAKGIGFGAALVLATVAATLIWDRDRTTARALLNLPAGCWASLLALLWPLTIVARFPGALDLWTMHVSDRLSMHSQHFAGEPAWAYGFSYFWQTLPWTPIALIAVWPSWKRAAPRAQRARSAPLGLGDRTHGVSVAGERAERPLFNICVAALVGLGRAGLGSDWRTSDAPGRDAGLIAALGDHRHRPFGLGLCGRLHLACASARPSRRGMGVL